MKQTGEASVSPVPYGVTMAYPKWRHHPELESMIVMDEGVEESQTPDSEGWRDDRNFPSDDAPKPKGKPGPKPKVRE